MVQNSHHFHDAKYNFIFFLLTLGLIITQTFVSVWTILCANTRGFFLKPDYFLRPH